MLALIIEYVDIYSIFNLGLTCSRLNQDIHRNEHIGRIALNVCPSHIHLQSTGLLMTAQKASYSAEAIVANATKEFARGFRRLAKRRMAVRSAEPWTVAIIAMADRFTYTDGYLCYAINEKHLCILNIRQTRTTELMVNILRIMQHAVRDFNESLTYTLQPLYCAKGILSCLAIQVDGQYTCCWLIIFEAKDNLKWTRQWSDGQIILWDFDGSKAGDDICFEIIDHYFYCVSLERRHQTDHELRAPFYQAVQFPTIDKRWASLQLIKDENTGDIFIVEKLPTDPEWECKEDSQIRHFENIHVSDNQSDATIYTLLQCPLHTYNPSCDAFVDLVYGEKSPKHILQLRDQTVKLWPEKPSPSQPDDALAQLHEIINLSQIYSHKPAPGQPPGQLRPITLMSFDSSLRFPGFPKHPSRTTNADRASESASVGPGDVALPSPPGSLGEWLSSGCGDESTSPFVRLSPPLYQNMSTGAGTQHGFDMSYDNGTAGIT
ncbi:hypothetical protein B0J15DRAFT_569414 [Fusarium solani]|uniref:F-box domain-containing protein n=1 Tax=Fusarium solani TaxID=169388 RepID=A0A9P9GE26_FUSSL|nr:uncharacterized protein B0J15DRAFT_569414 [Fusarium solani]KAH7237844.1 hypothetical protein B0J15DRAFT_569414 [Fusarium solani]